MKVHSNVAFSSYILSSKELFPSVTVCKNPSSSRLHLEQLLCMDICIKDPVPRAAFLISSNYETALKLLMFQASAKADFF